MNSPKVSIISSYPQLTSGFNHFNLSSTHQWLHSFQIIMNSPVVSIISSYPELTSDFEDNLK
jgi:hypothetical protein